MLTILIFLKEKEDGEEQGMILIVGMQWTKTSHKRVVNKNLVPLL